MVAAPIPIFSQETADPRDGLDEIKGHLEKILAAMQVIEAMPESAQKTVLHDGIQSALQVVAKCNETSAELSAAAGPPLVGDDFPEIRLRDGKSYKGAKIRSITEASILLAHTGGVASVPFTNLPPEWQERFGFDPFAPAIVIPTSSRDAPSALDDGINISGIDAREVDYNSDVYTKVAWKVTILNNAENPLQNVSLYFVFLDSSKFELESEIEYPLSFEAGETRTITGQTLMLRSVWEKVASYAVRTK